MHLLGDRDIARFLADGFIRLEPDVEPGLHADIDAALRDVCAHEFPMGNNIAARIPAIWRVLRCPVLDGALTSLLGPNYCIHPHRAIHSSTPAPDTDPNLDPSTDAPPMGAGSMAGSGWHQDAQSPLSRPRHHLPRYLIGFYFPHEVPIEMGPTRIQAGSQLFAHPGEPSDVLLPEDIGAGTLLLLHFDMVHAAFPNRTAVTRYMLKFVFARGAPPPASPAWEHHGSAFEAPANRRTHLDLSAGAWAYAWQWLRGASFQGEGGAHLDDLETADPERRLRTIYALAEPRWITALCERLRARRGLGLHERILRTGADGRPRPRDDIRGYPRRWNERAVVMEDAAYALGAIGPEAEPALVELLEEDDPWVRINALFALGEAGACRERTLAAIMRQLDDPRQQVVRTALDALAAIGTGLEPAIPAIGRQLTRDEPDWRQPLVERGWVGRDQVHLNAAFALRAALVGGADPEPIEPLLEQALTDPNGYVPAVAVDALRLIGSQRALDAAIGYLAERRWDDTLAAGKRLY